MFVDRVLTVQVPATRATDVDGSLIESASRDPFERSAEVTDPVSGLVYRRRQNGVYYRLTTSLMDDLLHANDEILAVDGYELVDMTLETAR